MSTTIEWTQRPGTKGETWNPTTGCNKISAGCKNCYAEIMHRRLAAMGQRKYDRAFSAGVVTHADTLTIPFGWKKPRTVFVNSMSDLFHADVPFEFIDQVFAIMALTPQHTYQILTKRPERMAEYFATRDKFVAIPPTVIKPFAAKFMPENQVVMSEMRQHPLPNVWLGTSVENQATANERIPHLLRVPAAVRFLSCEPLLGAVDLKVAPLHQWPTGEYWLPNKGESDDWKYHMHRIDGIHWVIAGGESGPGARAMHPNWAHSLRDQCHAAGVPIFFKQWGEWEPIDQPWKQDSPTPLATNEQWLNYEGGQGFHGEHVWRMRRVGKHASGNLLDGQVHNAFPVVTAPSTTQLER